jgi:hypothetical protein
LNGERHHDLIAHQREQIQPDAIVYIKVQIVRHITPIFFVVDTSHAQRQKGDLKRRHKAIVDHLQATTAGNGHDAGNASLYVDLLRHFGQLRLHANGARDQLVLR